MTDAPQYLFDPNRECINLVLSDDVRHHLTTPCLQTLVGQRLKAHLVAVEGGCL